MRPSDSAASRGTSISGLPPDPAPEPAQDHRPPADPAPGTPPAPGTAPAADAAPALTAPAARPDPARTPAPADQARTPAPPASRHLALVWSAERDGPAYRNPAARAFGLVDAADRRAVRALRECVRGPQAAVAARVLGLTGEHGAVWLGAGLAGALADSARRGPWLRATAAVGAAHLLSMGLKRVVRRPRPHIPDGPPLVRTAGRHGFPSSHAASSTAAAVAYGALLPGAVTVPALAAAICVSRLVAGVHYPSDVAAGALLGAATAYAMGGGRHG